MSASMQKIRLHDTGVGISKLKRLQYIFKAQEERGMEREHVCERCACGLRLKTFVASYGA